MSDQANENIIIDEKRILNGALALVKVAQDLENKTKITKKHLIDILSVSAQLQEEVIFYLRQTGTAK
jgi:hypothetical protein